MTLPAPLAAAAAAHRVVLVTFSSPHCSPCRSLARALDAEPLQEQDIGHVYVDITKDPTTALPFAIKGTPTLVALCDGEVVARTTGFAGTPALRRFIAGALDAI